MPRILFLVPYPLQAAPSQRFRFEQYFSLLVQQGYRYEVQSFLSQKGWAVLYKPGHFLAKVLAILGGFGRRVLVLFRAGRYDFVFVHREAAPLGPPFFEWCLARV